MPDELDIFADVPQHLVGMSGGLTLSINGGVDRIYVEEGVIHLSTSGHVREVGRSLDVVFVGAAEHTSRAYYQGDSRLPTCYSKDGIAPAATPGVQAASCMGCPQNEVGSRISNGRKVKACGHFHRFAVVVPGQWECVYQLDVRTQGLYGTSKKQEQLYSMKEYSAFLKHKGVTIDKLVTRVSLDPDVAYAKLLFSPSRFVSVEETPHVAELLGSSLTNEALAVSLDTAEQPQESAPVSGTGLFITT